MNTDPEFGTEKLLERAEIEKTAAEERKSVATPSPLGPLGFDFAHHRQTLRQTLDGTRSKALRPFGSQ